MKTCPQCEFIYEDSQSLCDMDGRDLISDEQSFPKSSAASETKPTTKSRSKHKPVFSLLGIVLGVVLLALGYAAFERAISNNLEPGSVSAMDKPQISLAPVPVKASPAETSPAAEEPKEDMSDAEDSAHQVKAVATRSQANVRKLSEKKLGSEALLDKKDSGVEKPAGVTRKEAGRPAGAHSRKDSKVTSLLKKTGRILSKPFRL